MSLQNVSLSAPPRQEMIASERVAYDKQVRAQLAKHEARLNGKADQYGLVPVVTKDRTGREITSFDTVSNRKLWMDEFKGPGFLQIAIHNRKVTEQEMQEVEANWRSVRGLK